MSKNEKLAVLAVAIVGAGLLHKFADKEAKALGIPLGVVSVAVWALSQ